MALKAIPDDETRATIQGIVCEQSAGKKDAPP
jgi:hypothetical protein